MSRLIINVFRYYLMWVSFVWLLTVRLYNYLDYNANLYTFKLLLYILIKIKNISININI